jgi:hypothetical protein
MGFLISIRDYETKRTGSYISYMLQENTTLRNLKEKFSNIKGGTIKVEDLRAWTESGTRLENDDRTLGEYGLAYNDVMINMATGWPE